MKNLFAYGTLCVPEIYRLVTGCDRRPIPAVLHGHECLVVNCRVYPGVIEHPESSVGGVVYEEITDLEVSRLDAYEDDFYQRVELSVELFSNESVLAECYIVPPGARDMLGTNRWSRETFEREHLTDFLARLRKRYD